MPARFSSIIRALRHLGFEVAEPNAGSHWHVHGPGGKAYTVPAHNGPKSEIDDKYIRGLCRAFGIDEKDFRSRL